MSDKKQNNEKKQPENHYNLKTDAIDRLVNAKNKEYPKTKTDPGKKYRSGGFFDRIPAGIKALFIKFWFSGAVCFFVFWGLGNYIADSLDMIVIIGIILGIVNDLLVNNILHFFAVIKGANDKWMMFPQKKHWTIFANIGYCLAVLFVVITIYNTVNLSLNAINGTEKEVYLGVEPLLFGVLFTAIDVGLIGIKHLIRSIISDAINKTKVEK